MSSKTAELFIEILSLPAQNRAELAERLLASLEDMPSSAEIEQAWKTEALARCEAADRGELLEKDVAEVLQNTRRRLE